MSRAPPGVAALVVELIIDRSSWVFKVGAWGRRKAKMERTDGP